MNIITDSKNKVNHISGICMNGLPGLSRKAKCPLHTDRPADDFENAFSFYKIVPLLAEVSGKVYNTYIIQFSCSPAEVL